MAPRRWGGCALAEANDPVAALRARLRELYRQVRTPPYRQLQAQAERAGLRLAPTTIGGLLNGPGVPRWDTVEAFVTACRRRAQTYRPPLPLPVEMVDLDRWRSSYEEIRMRREERGGSARRDAGRMGGTARAGSPNRPQAVHMHAERDVYVAQRMEVHHHHHLGMKPALVVPRQLPASVRHFAGRAAELAALAALLEEGSQAGGTVVVSAIGGTAGIGKTALAIYWAHHVAHRFPDGQLYVNLRGFDSTGAVMVPGEAVRIFLDAFAVSTERIPADLNAQTALYRSLLAGKRMLVVLDNARDSAQVRPLLPGAPGCLVLVTSRNELSSLIAVEGAHPLTLNLFSESESQTLLSLRLGRTRLAAEPAAVKVIVAACARLPLALAIVAARAERHPQLPLATLAGELRDAHARLDALRAEDAISDVRAVLSWSYQRLSPDAARLFRLLGLHPGPDIAMPAVASLAGTPEERARRLIVELTEANLLAEPSPGRLTFHDLLRTYARELAETFDTEVERQAATRRLLDHYLYTAYTADLLLYPQRDRLILEAPQPYVAHLPLSDREQALAWFTAEHRVLVAAVDQAAGCNFDTHVWQLAWALTTFFDRCGHWHDQLAVQRAGLGATLQLADATAQAHARRSLARACTRLGNFDDAHAQLGRALDLFAELDDHVGQAHTRLALGWTLERQGRIREALSQAQQALVLYQVAGHWHGQARAFNNMGWHHALLGEYQQALAECQNALALHQRLGDRHGEAETWDSLGYAYDHLGDHAEAITCFRKALELFRDIGAQYYEADTIARLGDAYHAVGNLDLARDAWQHALEILDQVNHPEGREIRDKLGRTGAV
jgi:tetratricopeptide (TPR) repeat protein